MMKTSSAAILTVLLVCAVSMLPAVHAEESENLLLIDLGNGQVYWYEISMQGTYADIAESAALSLNIEININNPADISIGNLSSVQIGSIETNWKIYSWDGKWNYEPNLKTSSVYAGGTVALGFYPDSSYEDIICPVATPEYKTVWTQHGGSSSASNVSDSYGTTAPSLPVEWYNTYTTGFVDSSLIVAGDLLYHTSGGTWGAKDDTGDPWIYCLNRFTGEIIWKYHGEYGAGYEVTTPVVIGDMLIVSMTCSSILCFNRYSGELLHTLKVEYKPPMNSNHDVYWDSRTFVTGATTPVYDSGALYFGSADGKVYCYSISYSEGFNQIWCYNPPDGYSEEEGYTGTKGMFYYHAPTIADINGERVLFIGNYGGYLFSINASNGELIWVRSVVDYSDKTGSEIGSAATASLSRDGTILLVTCTDAAMESTSGYAVALDPLTGMGYNGEEYIWKIDALVNYPVICDDGFYLYMSPSVYGTEQLTLTTGEKMDPVHMFCKFNWNGELVWSTAYQHHVKAAMTLADGVLYAMDYSAAASKAGGGHFTAINAEDGTILYSLTLRPFHATSFSMVQPTVIDGKIYVANDYGAVYCISDIAGPTTAETEIKTLETVGFDHWSWYALIAVVIATIGIFLILYRGA